MVKKRKKNKKLKRFEKELRSLATQYSNRGATGQNKSIFFQIIIQNDPTEVPGALNQYKDTEFSITEYWKLYYSTNWQVRNFIADKTYDKSLLFSLTKDKSFKVFMTAINRLNELGIVEDFNEAVVKYSTSDFKNRIAQNSKDEKLLLQLISDSTEYNINLSAFKTLDKLGFAEKAYEKMANSENWQTRKYVAQKSGNKTLVLKLASDKEPDVVKTAYTVLVKSGYKKEAFRAMAQSENVSIRKYIAQNSNSPKLLKDLTDDKATEVNQIANLRYNLLKFYHSFQESMGITLEKKDDIYGLWIQKGPFINNSGDIHWRDRSHVYYYTGESYEFITTTAKNKAFKIAEKKLNDTLFKNSIGEYVNEDGIKLPDILVKTVNEIFLQVRTGIKILPANNTSDYNNWVKTILKKVNVNQKIKYRTWGQQFLSTLSPTKVEKGELLGSGGTYLAYYFKFQYGAEKVIVEFDQDGSATHLFDAEQFDHLRFRGRMKLRTENPVGYDGFVIHKGKNGKSKWKNSIMSYLKYGPIKN